jgi:glutathione-regulated potassium-efflux system ancillary protein KefF
VRCAARTCGWCDHRRLAGVVPPDRYNRYFFDAFLPPYEQTAVLCGMRFLPPMMLHGAHRVSDASSRARDVYAERLRSYPDWPELAELGSCPECEVPATSGPPRRRSRLSAALSERRRAA